MKITVYPNYKKFDFYKKTDSNKKTNSTDISFQGKFTCPQITLDRFFSVPTFLIPNDPGSLKILEKYGEKRANSITKKLDNFLLSASDIEKERYNYLRNIKKYAQDSKFYRDDTIVDILKYLKSDEDFKIIKYMTSLKDNSNKKNRFTAFQINSIISNCNSDIKKNLLKELLSAKRGKIEAHHQAEEYRYNYYDIENILKDIPEENYNLIPRLERICYHNIASDKINLDGNNIYKILKDCKTPEDSNEILKVLGKFCSYEPAINYIDNVFCKGIRLHKAVKNVEIMGKDKPKDFNKWLDNILFNKPTLTNISNIPDLTEEILTNSLYSTSKMIECIKKNPEKYINSYFYNNDLRKLKNFNKIFEENNFIKFSTIDDLQRNFRYHVIPDLIYCNAVTDSETTKLLLDKKIFNFEKFTTRLKRKKNHEHLKEMRNIICNGKRLNKKNEPDKLTGAQKLDVANIFAGLDDLNELDTNKFKTFLDEKKKTFLFDIEGLKDEIFNNIIKDVGLQREKLSCKNLNWDRKYIVALWKRISNTCGELYSDIFRESSLGQFEQFINNPKNIYGEANIITKKQFIQAGLDFEKWDKGIEKHEITIAEQPFSIKLWNRKPQESIFDGHYTTCCTSLDGINGSQMALYLTNKAINIIEIRDKNNNVIAMTRCFIAKCSQDDKNKLALILDNFEINNVLLDKLSQKEQKEFISSVTKYVKEYAKAVGGEKMPIFLTCEDLKFNKQIFKDLDFYKIDLSVKLLGEISSNSLYFNYVGEKINPKNSVYTDLYVIKL